jgi:Predicted membrane protein
MCYRCDYWLAGQIMRGHGFGLLANIVIGIVGSILGGLIFGHMLDPILGEGIGGLATSLLGAIILVFVIGLFAKK